MSAPLVPSQTIDEIRPDWSQGVDEVVDRLLTFDQLWSALEEPPEGPALIYEVPGNAEVRCLPLDQAITVVGRLPRSADPEQGADLAFPGLEKLSKRHFQIRRDEEEFVLEDLGSRNGTYVNVNHQPTARKALVGGDLIYAGGVIFAFTGD